jgi:hypothetical protein
MCYLRNTNLMEIGPVRPSPRPPRAGTSDGHFNALRRRLPAFPSKSSSRRSVDRPRVHRQ